MHNAQDYYPGCPELMIVSLARTGDRNAFEELVRRRQSPIRNLMRRFCNNDTLADDLAQQVFLQVWLKIRTLRRAKSFPAWLKRLAVRVWLQHLRKNDALHNAGELTDVVLSEVETHGVGMDLDQALGTLPETVRSCVVLSYHEGMSHREIAKLMGLPMGTVKSHINRGAQRLRQVLSAYQDKTEEEKLS